MSPNPLFIFGPEKWPLGAARRLNFPTSYELSSTSRGATPLRGSLDAHAPASHAAPGDRPAPRRDPRVTTPKHLADKILTSRAGLEGERKQVTVLFADVKGSMELAEQLDPEAFSRIMQRVQEVVQSLLDCGRLTGSHGAYRLVGTVEAVDIPTTVQTLLAARIDLLGDTRSAPCRPRR